MQHLSYKQLEGERRLNIIEASILGAGLEYKKVELGDDFPSYFSVPPASYATKIDQNASDAWHEELVRRFGKKIPSTNASPEIELARGSFLALETCRRIVPILCVDVWRRHFLAQQFRRVKDNKQAAALIREITGLDAGCTCVPGRGSVFTDFSFAPMVGSHWTGTGLRAAYRACVYASIDPHVSARMAGEVVNRCCYRSGARRQFGYLGEAAQILDDAIAIR